MRRKPEVSYHEISMKGYPAASLHIEPGHGATVFDVDYVGQNDGQDPDPDASFRLIFQLGSGLMIYLYVVGMTRPGNRRGFHTFWIKYCAAMDVEMEELGPPSHVEGGPFELPVVFKGFTLSHGAEQVNFEVVVVTHTPRS
jgi:hypothetical protein